MPARFAFLLKIFEIFFLSQSKIKIKQALKCATPLRGTSSPLTETGQLWLLRAKAGTGWGDSPTARAEPCSRILKSLIQCLGERECLERR